MWRRQPDVVVAQSAESQYFRRFRRPACILLIRELILRPGFRNPSANRLPAGLTFETRNRDP